MKVIPVIFLVFSYYLSPAQELPLETVVQTGHYESVEALRFSTDNKYLVSAGRDNTIKLWEIATGREVRTFYGSPYTVMAVDISPDNSLIASVNLDSSVWIWDALTGEVLRKLKDSEDAINNVRFHPDGERLITGAKNRNVLIWDLSTWEISMRLTGVPIGCYAGDCRVSLDISADGRLLATGVSDRTVITWDLRKGDSTGIYKDHTGSCSSCMAGVALFDRGRKLVSVSSRDSIRIRDTRSGEILRVFPSRDGYEQISADPSGRWLAALSRGRLWVLDAGNGRVTYEEPEYRAGVHTAQFSPDGRYLALGGTDKTIRLLQTGTFREAEVFSGLVNTFEDSLNYNIRTWVKNKNTQTVSPDGRIVARGKIDTIARLWSMESGRILRDLKGHSGPVIDLAFSPDGKYLATASGDRTARIWRVEDGEQLAVLRGHRDVLFSIDYSSDGKKLVTSGWDGRVVVWDVETRRALSIFSPHGQHAPVETVFAPNGLYVISAGLDQKLKMIEMDTGEPVLDLIGHKHHVVSLDLDPGGRYLLSGSWDGLAKIWDLTTGFQTARLQGHEREIYDVTFSPDGNLVATASGDKRIGVWAAGSGELKFFLNGHRGAVTSVEFSRDGGRIISGSRDGTTRVWDIESGKELYTHVFTGSSDWLVMRPSGHFYATDGARNSIFFVRGLQTYRIDRFFDDFFQPGILQELNKPVERDMRGASLIEQLQEYPPPEVEIISPKPPYSTDKSDMSLMVRVTDQGGGVNLMRVSHNGKMVVEDAKDLDRLNRKGRSLVKQYEISLIPGYNEVEISALSKGNIESRPQRLNLFLPGEIPKSNCYIFSVGINEYRNPSLNLNYARPDARSFASELKKRSRDLYEKVIVEELLDEKATRENMLNTLRELASEVTLNDVFYFFYAGHGSLVNGEFYFIPSEVTRLYDESTLREGAISASEMNEFLRGIPALKQVVVMDACHSGGSTELLAERGAGEEKALAQLSRSAGIHVLAAAGSEQTAAEFRELGHGLFTYMIIEALSGKADGAPSDSKVTVYELKSFLDAMVPEYSEKYKGSPQFPSTFSRGQDFPVILNEN